MHQIRIVGLTGALDLRADRAGRFKKKYNKATNEAQVIAHNHAGSEFLGSQAAIVLAQQHLIYNGQ